jgi:hypothetical protein
MAKLMLQLILLSILTEPIHSQNEQNENHTTPLNRYSFKDTSSFRFINSAYLLQNLSIPINNLMTRNLNYSYKGSINFKKKINSENEYNYLLQPEITRNHPLIYDFNKSKSDLLFGRFYICSNSLKRTYIGLGEYLQLGGALEWKPYNKISIDAGSFFFRQYNYFSGLRSDIYGIHTKTKYDLTSKLQFSIYGQYIGTSSSNFFYGNTLFPNSSIGSSLLFKVKKQTQIDVGVKYQYYENKKIWDLESASKVSIGF